MLDQDFYPTPAHLIEKMLEGVYLDAAQPILEPSAGKGDICDYIKERCRYNRVPSIDTIELDPNLQHVLRGKEYAVVHDDFLTFKSSKQYGLIVANFPFSEGDKHLQKALGLLEQSGGALICLVNAETIRNPYTNLRKSLVAKLDACGARVEYLEGEFTEAERKTNVEVALIRLHVEAQAAPSILLDSLSNAEELEATEAEQRQVVEADFMKALIKRFNTEVRAGIKLINEYNALAPLMLDSMPKKDKNEDYSKPMLTLGVGDRNNYHYGGSIVNDYLCELRLKYWRVLIGDSRFTGRFTSNINKSLSEKLSKLKDYDFTEFNIRQLEEELNNKLITGIEDAILHLFDELSGKYSYHEEFGDNIHYYNGWKSNKAHKINQKVILPIDGFGSYRWRRDKLDDYGYVSERIQDMVKVFNYLAGDLDSVNGLVRTSIQHANNIGNFRHLDFYYFDATFFKKGTCHITFKDQKLLDKFNIFGSRKKGWLPPIYGRKAYSEMDADERQVVDDFQGEEAYAQVVADKDYYLVEASRIALTAGSME